MRGIRVGVILLIAIFTASAHVISGTVNAIIPAGNFWLWITDGGIIASPTIPHSLHGKWPVNLVCSNGPIKIYELIKGPWVCKVEALNLLGAQPKPQVFWNSTIKGLECGERYLLSDVKEMISKGNQTVVMVPLSGSICKRVKVNATINGENMIINITMIPIKPWVKICPASKMIDVVLVWGKAKSVDVIVNGKEILYAKSK
ncbi:hypothetical protein IPA_07125 [Ignicoccus pacificus DSM 13166]|uniref:Uncharacterized protein n=1 Tax=Ignicoccus pacificus DSM 13166 TaxID=940294 RepID=A0A977KBN2_9CREN|nr:hypothetical protein IPA_07125 [Ignicoccus pacificus DSM 13166]